MNTAWIVLIAFWTLTLAVLATGQGRAMVRSRDARAWVLDVVGLVVQGALIPLAQVWLVFAGLAWLWPEGQGSWALPGWAAFLLSFVGVDYLYYWNHRLLHTTALWPLHRVHHTLLTLDVLGTSRNTIYSSLLIVYLWVGGGMLFLLTDPLWFAVGASVTAALDLWRHSPFTPPRASAWHRFLGAVLIMPSDHAWHHSTDAANNNYGANFSLWDRLHRTHLSADSGPSTLGIEFDASLGRQLLYPFGEGRRELTS